MNIDSLFDLSGKVAIVTGGGDGIGKGSCETLAHFGASIVVSDLVLEKAQAVANEIVKHIAGYSNRFTSILNDII